MEKRLLLAIGLMIVVAVVPSVLIKSPPRRPNPPAAAVDSARPSAMRVDSGSVAAAPRTGTAPTAVAAPTTAFDTAVIERSRARLRLTTAGAAIDHAVFPAYKSFQKHGQVVDLIRAGDRMLVTRFVIGNDTVKLDSVPFTLTTTANGVTMTGQSGRVRLTVTYAASTSHDYLYEVSGRAEGLEAGALMMVGLGTGFAQDEADSMDNYRYYGVSVRRGSPQATNFRDVPGDSVRTVSGPFDWVALKSKYFLAALISADSTRPQFGGVVMHAEARPNRRVASHVDVWATMPVGPDGRFSYGVFLGPQEARALHALGRDLDRASPYGWAIFRPIIMPVASLVARLLRWMHENFHMAYGWVLVVFGIMVRLVLWPLNQRAMKSQVAMMAVQPLLKDAQERHKNEPDKQQAEVLKIYREHKVNPVGGCLPLLLPWPVLIALFFAFSKAIELRGAPFFWLPDLAQRDPYYIIPLLMGASMYALSKLSQAGMPPNPQTKMMTVVMPVMMTVLFLNFPSGLNLYYAVSNIVSLPQQWFINKARMAEMQKRKPS